MHDVAVVIEDCSREFLQSFGGARMNALTNDHALAGAFVFDFVGLHVLHAAHEPTQVEVEC